MNILLENYKKLVEYLSLMLGPHYEIILYDTSLENYPIIALANGDITGAKKGSFAIPFIVDIIKENKDKEYKVNYENFTTSGKSIRSSMFFIKDENNELVGVMNMNFDDSMFVNLVQDMLKLLHPDETLQKSKDVLEEETLSKKIYNVIEEYLKNNHMLAGHYTKYEFDSLIAILSQDSRLQIITSLEAKGIFKIKGAVIEVAKILQISEPSVYRYLSKVKTR
jgi:predicted transcriptional regulator YheO